MISADFYPSTATYCDGAVLCTNNITNIVVEENIEDIAKPYYIGYVKYDDMPKMCVPMFNRTDTVADDKIITFYQTPENHSWGFVRSNYSGTDTHRVKNMYYRTAFSSNYYNSQYTSENNLHRFFNKIEMCNHATADKVTLGFHAFVVPIADIVDGTTTFKSAQSDNTYTLKTFTDTYDSNLGENVVNLNILLRLINNEIPVMTGSTNIGGESLPIEDFYYSDFNEYGLAYKDTTNGIYRVFMWIDQILIPGWGEYYNGTNRYSSPIEPFFEFTLEEVSGSYPEQTALYTPGQWKNNDFRIRMVNNDLRLTSTGMFNGFVTPVYVPYSISQKDLLDADIYWQRNGVVKNSYVLIEAGGSGNDFNHHFYPHYDLKDIYKYLMFYHKIDTQGTTYQNTTASDTYTTRYSTALFDSNDTPLYERVTEDYQTIITKLRPWQMPNVDITVNEYDPADKPEYEPGVDGDDQGSNTGSVLRPTTLGVGGTNGFITQYSMTAAQIAEIGRLLWLSFTDPDYYKNFLFTLTTTGTLNISNLLDYFVSLRVYPFPLINVPSHTAAGQDMWIGAGLVPLSFNTNLHTINNYADYIDAGSCTIPRYYNDFRDFSHTQIMLYLPYCGTVQLNPADVVGSTLHAQYAVDFATGGVTAYVDCTTWDGSQFVIAVLTGSIGADIPLTASNAAQIAARIAGDALNFAGTVGEAISNDYGNTSQAITSAAVGDFAGAAIGVANTYAGRIGGAVDVAQAGLQIAAAEGVKMPMLSGGRGFGSFGAPQTAYVQIRRGIYAEGQQPPQGFKEAYGEAYSKPVQVSSCTGFTVFANVDTSGLQCDAMEREQVKKMMQAGIYI